MSGLSTVLFDFGGVVIRTPFELLDTDWQGPFDPSLDPLWRAFQAGDMTEREYWHTRARQRHPDADEPVGAFMRTLYDTDEAVIVRPEIPVLLDELEGHGLHVAVLTNDLAAFHSDEWIDRMTVIRRFDPVIDLSHVGFLKPSTEAFTHACKLLDTDAGEVVFVDDQPANIAGARAYGLTAVWFDPTDIDGSIAQVLAAGR